MNLFSWRKSLSISEEDPTFKVRYLGNVQTAVMKGEGCADRAASIIWNNYMRSEHPGIEMKMELSCSGIKAYTKEQGLTEYRAHRISYCIAHPDYPRLFVWVYRHEGRKMKMELRCHAVLCKNETKAKTLAYQLHQKVSCALKEFQREKLRKQTSRLTFQRAKSTVNAGGNILPLRTQLLSTAKNFRPPVSKSNAAAKLGAITEDVEDDECIEEEEEDEIDEMSAEYNNNNNGEDDAHSGSLSAGSSPSGPVHKGLKQYDILEALDLGSPDSLDGDFFDSEHIIDLELGNDLDELRRDDGVQYCLHGSADSDEESAESGFHDQEQDLAEMDREKDRDGNRVGEEEGSEVRVFPLPALDEDERTTNTATEKTAL